MPIHATVAPPMAALPTDLIDLVALSDEWVRLEGQRARLADSASPAVSLDWIVRRQASIRDAMLGTPAASLHDVGAKHRVATGAGHAERADHDLLESAEADVIRLFYG
ncbi:MAG: hypothetical protein EA406_07500 [Rhodospirillales bacterium]|nr:MAG: hypothetical protein EA406_07500 [Rhodospirillales bacterium]